MVALQSHTIRDIGQFSGVICTTPKLYLLDSVTFALTCKLLHILPTLLQYHTEALEALRSRKDEELASKEGEIIKLRQ